MQQNTNHCIAFFERFDLKPPFPPIESNTGAVESHATPFDIGLALHACGVATDLVIDRCLEARAALVLAPCCIGMLAREHHFKHRPRSRRYADALTAEEMRLISAHSDCTVRGADSHSATDFLRRECRRTVDDDRLALCEEAGYRAARFTMTPFACTCTAALSKSHIAPLFFKMAQNRVYVILIC